MNDEVKLDLVRENRTGLSEAIFCEGKSGSQLLYICEAIKAHGKPVLFTRLSQAQYELLNDAHPQLLEYNPISRTATSILWTPNITGNITGTPNIITGTPNIDNQASSNSNTRTPNNRVTSVAVVSGGSSDVPVASEVVETLGFYGISSLTINDVGVAGLWRLTERLDEIRAHKIVICIAGMDAALPTVLGGLISSAIIAVPTSVGYGMAKDGETALRSLLVSCSPGICVVNIDNGYGAACAAVRMLNQLSR